MDTETQHKIESLRSKVAADPRTKAIAKSLQMSVEDYAGLVAHFKITGEQPQFMVVSDEVLKQHGVQPVSKARVETFLKGEKKVIEVSGRASSFDNLPAVTSTSKSELPTTKADPALADDLKRAMRTTPRR
jgi:hypothetical protein